MASLANTSVSSAVSLIGLQLFSRSFTFILNQALVRLASPEVFGTAAVHFELLLSTILFISREGVRNALLRRKASQSHNRFSKTTQAVDNISQLPIVAGVPIAMAASLIYYYFSGAAVRTQPYFTASVTVYALAAITELLSEPYYINTQNTLRLDLRVKAEGAGIVAKNVTSFLILAFMDAKFALLAFAVGQMAYSVVVFYSYFRSIGPTPISSGFLEPQSSGNKSKEPLLDPELLGVSIAMTKQSLVKHLLTEGDKFMVARISPLEDQGGYALASNYGSLVARVLFQPIEETARLFFSKTLFSVLREKKTDDRENEKDSQKAITTARRALQSLLLLQVHFAFQVITFGPPYLNTLLKYVLPRKYLATSAPLIMRAYIFYIPSMALNGILEAFVSSVSTPSEPATQSRWMVAFSVVYIASGALFAVVFKMGDAGLVWANVMNSLVRALYCWSYASQWFAKRKERITVKAIFPPISATVVFVVAGLATRILSHSVRDRLTHDLMYLATGVCCVGACGVVCFMSERAALSEMIGLVR